MNPEIDLSSFRKSGTPAGSSPRPHATAAVPVPRVLVSPPRRITSRYVLPLVLLSAFVGVLFHAFRGSLVRPIPVQVEMPVLLAGGGPVPTSRAGAGTPAVADSRPAPAPAASADPLFQAPGWIEPAPYAYHATAQSPGVLASVEVLEGQPVEQGQVVARLIDGDARLAVQQAEATLALRKAEHEAAKAAWENPIALVESIRTGEADDARLKAEKARHEQTAALADREAKRSEDLRRTGVEATVLAERTATEAQTSRLSALETEARIKANAAALQAARDRYRLRIEDRERLSVATAQLRAAQTALADARYRLGLRTVTAPTTGVVMRLLAEPGTMLSPDMPQGMRIASIYDPERIQVRADVPLANAGRLQPGMIAEIRCEALPERTFRGELVRIVHEADIQRNTLPVKVRILDPDPGLKPEMIARLQFYPAPVTSEGTLPPESPEADGGGEERRRDSADATDGTPRVDGSLSGRSLWVSARLLPGNAAAEARLWLAAPDGTARPRDVRLSGARRDGLRQIAAGLTVADKIIIDPPADLAPGTPVRIEEPKPNKSTGTGDVNHAAH